MLFKLEKIGAKMKALRRSKGLSCQELAQCAALSPSYYKAIEEGRENFSVQDLISIALSLEVEVEDLLPSLNSLCPSELPLKKRSHLFVREDSYSCYLAG